MRTSLSRLVCMRLLRGSTRFIPAILLSSAIAGSLALASVASPRQLVSPSRLDLSVLQVAPVRLPTVLHLPSTAPLSHMELAIRHHQYQIVSHTAVGDWFSNWTKPQLLQGTLPSSSHKALCNSTSVSASFLMKRRTSSSNALGFSSPYSSGADTLR